MECIRTCHSKLVGARESRLVPPSDLQICRWPRVTLTFDLLTPKVDGFMSLPLWTTYANWRRSRFIRFQNIARVRDLRNR